MPKTDPDKVKLKLKVKRAGRKRRTLGWTILVLGLLVAGVWGASRWWRTAWASGDMRLVIAAGTIRGARDTGLPDYLIAAFPLEWEPPGPIPGRPRLELLAEEPEPLGGQYSKRVHLGLVGWKVVNVRLKVIEGGEIRYTTCSFSIVLWPIPLLLWTPAALLLRSGILARRRAMKGMCGKCGYSLAGLASDAPCPECGKTKTS